MALHGTRAIAASGAALALLIVAPAAHAAPKLDGQLVAAAQAKGSKVRAPILLSARSAKKIGLDSPLATLSLKRSKDLPAPNPFGPGELPIAAKTLRAGDEIAGRGKLKGNKRSLMPTVKGSKIEVTSRESRFSVEELTDALVALSSQINALTVRVDGLEASFQSQLDALRAELEQLKAQNASLAGQVNSILAQIASLNSAVSALQSSLSGLTSQLGALDAQLDSLADQLDALEADLNALESTVGTLGTNLGALQTTVDGLVTDVNAICSAPLLSAIGIDSCP